MPKRNLELEFGNETIETVKPKKKETACETLKRLTGIDISPEMQKWHHDKNKGVATYQVTRK